MTDSTSLSDRASRVFEDTETRCEAVAADRAIVSGGAQDSYRHALQALRDVRHMLPPDGVSIVDAVLDGATFGHHEQVKVGTPLIAPRGLAHQDAPLNPEQEDEFLEAALLN